MLNKLHNKWDSLPFRDKILVVLIVGLITIQLTTLITALIFCIESPKSINSFNYDTVGLNSESYSAGYNACLCDVIKVAVDSDRDSTEIMKFLNDKVEKIRIQREFHKNNSILNKNKEK